MSTISDAYDEIMTSLAATLSGYQIIPDPIDLEENNEQFLKKGYGLTIGSVINPQIELCDRIHLFRQMSVVLTNKVYSRDFDYAARNSGQSSLISDADDVMLALHQLGLTTTNVINRLNVLSDSGVEQVFIDKDNFLSTTITLELKYRKGS